MANTTLTTVFHRDAMANAFLADVRETPYYIFVGDHKPDLNSSPALISPDVQDTHTDVYRNMIAGKRIDGTTDVRQAIRKIPYVANTVYSMYDDEDVNIDVKDFYVVVDESSFKHVYKCLDNFSNTPSTIPPSFSDVAGSNTTVYQTADGYRWKYMYSYDSNTAVKFETSTHVPYVANTDVESSAIPGAISIIKVDDPGKRYNNYVTGTFAAADIQANGDNTLYRVQNSSAATVNGFYTSCLLYLTTGTGAGQFRTVTDYISNANGNFVVVDSVFDTTPKNGTTFEIYPTVRVNGTGDETITCTARALINTNASNSIYRVEILEAGRDYEDATADVLADPTVGVTSNALVRPILPPRGGHGFDPATELFANVVIVSTFLANTEANTIPAANEYRQVGLVRNPVFNSVVIGLNTSSGLFLNGEEVLTISTRTVRDDLILNMSSNVVIANTINVDLRDQLTVGDEILLATADKTSYQYTVVTELTNTTSFKIRDLAHETSAGDGTLALVTPKGRGTVVNAASQSLIEATTDPTFLPGQFVVGTSSGAHGQIATVNRGGVLRDFTTFVALEKYVGSLSFGVFEQNEVLTQGTSSALLHSTSLNSGTLTLYVSNRIGDFQLANTVVGGESTAVASLTAKYAPEIVFGSGEITYLENVRDPIVRKADQTENFRITINF